MVMGVLAAILGTVVFMLVFMLTLVLMLMWVLQHVYGVRRPTKDVSYCMRIRVCVCVPAHMCALSMFKHVYARVHACLPAWSQHPRAYHMYHMYVS